MATKTYLRTGQIQGPLDATELVIYQTVSGEALGTTFQADLSAPNETWLIGHGVIAFPPDVAVTLPVNGPADGDLPTADGSGGFDWEQ